jgi:hypothetical protein
MAKSNAAKKSSPNTNPRGAILDAMKAHTSREPEARESFRGDVRRVLEEWDGAAPIVWFTWELGTHLMILGPQDAPRSKAHADRREVAVAIDMARGGKCFFVDLHGGKPSLEPIEFSDVVLVVREYYNDRTPLVSVHAV